MRRIIKDEEPEFWSKYIARHPRENYDDLDKTDEGKCIRHEIRMHMLAQQQYICCYCCKIINADNSHNEHIKPRDKYPNISMEYTNLLVSCKGITCGEKKDRKFDERYFVSPLEEDCEEHFSYLQNGEIKGETEAGKYTIELLNLNEKSLKNSRHSLFKECLQMKECCGKEYIESEYINPKDNKLPRFCGMVRYFMNRGYFDV